MSKQDLIWVRDNTSDENAKRATRWAINRIEELERQLTKCGLLAEVLVDNLKRKPKEPA